MWGGFTVSWAAVCSICSSGLGGVCFSFSLTSASGTSQQFHESSLDLYLTVAHFQFLMFLLPFWRKSIPLDRWPKLKENQFPGCAAPPSPASGSQSGCPGTLQTHCSHYRHSSWQQQGFICSQSPQKHMGMNIVFNLAQCSTGAWHETFLQGWKCTATSSQTQFWEVEL